MQQLKRYIILFALIITGTNVAVGQNNVAFYTSDYIVSKTIQLPLLVDSQPLQGSTVYKVGLVTLGTGTKTGSFFLVWKDTSGYWQIRNVTLSGTISNHPLLVVDSTNIVQVTTSHANTYKVRAFVEVIPAGVATVIPSLTGSYYQWQRKGNLLYYLDGNVGIGTTTPQSALAVNGTITAKQVKVTQSGWPDYVFDSSYAIPSLDSIKAFINRHHHLPDIPSVSEIESKGLDIGDMQKKQMQKIEELTLCAIDQDKQLKAQRDLLEQQQQQLKDQQQQITRLTAQLQQQEARLKALEATPDH